MCVRVSSTYPGLTMRCVAEALPGQNKRQGMASERKLLPKNRSLNPLGVSFAVIAVMGASMRAGRSAVRGSSSRPILRVRVGQRELCIYSM